MKSLRLLRFLLKRSRGVVVLMTCAGVLSGLISVAVVAIISRALHAGEHVPAYLVLGFVLLVAGKIGSGLASQLLFTRFSQGTILELSLTLAEKILKAPLRSIERHGAARVLSTLTDDVGSVTWAVQSLPRLATNAAVVLGCGFYLAWLSWHMALIGFAVTASGALAYTFMYKRAFDVIRAARETRSRLFEHFRTLTAGSKELKMHRARREEFLQGELRATADEFRRTNLAATTHYSVADAWLQCLLYILIGLLLFAYPAVRQLPAETLTGYVFTVLYMMAPLWAVINTVPAVTYGQVALAKIEELGISLDAEAWAAAVPASDVSWPAPLAISMEQVVFTYADGGRDEHGFTLGPIDFRLHGGELVFVVGGNGSGKSTFVKVLTGLYAPQRGAIRIGDKPVTEHDIDGYREHFSVVFADFHLFDKLLGLHGSGLDAAAQRYLQLLQIDRKVALRERTFSTTDLSQGQRKRLALVTAYLEDRSIYVFDEWAADQDPEYKQIFYSKLLPELRGRGKAVVVITHDDRYFHLGDRVMKLEEGKVVPPDAPAETRPGAQLATVAR
ncbi:MAG: cyclic peptide export ABC transporter [Gammaproteobacteria bacterium]